MKRMSKIMIIDRENAPHVKLKNISDTDLVISERDGEDWKSGDIKISTTAYDCGDYSLYAVDLKKGQSSEVESVDVLSAISTLETMTKLLRKKYNIKGVIK